MLLVAEGLSFGEVERRLVKLGELHRPALRVQELELGGHRRESVLDVLSHLRQARVVELLVDGAVCREVEDIRHRRIRRRVRLPNAL